MIITNITNSELSTYIKCCGPVYMVLVFKCPVCGKILTRTNPNTYKLIYIPKEMIAELIDDVLYLFRVSALACGFCEIDYENLPSHRNVIYIFSK